MKVELLFISDCPNYLEAWSLLEDVLQAERISAPIEMIRVRTAEDARRLRFPGSPTIRIDGKDIEEAPEAEYGLRYRRYKGASGPRGSPTRALIHQAVREQLGQSQTGKESTVGE